jgi:DNA polymerase-3 subunit gamma/tau
VATTASPDTNRSAANAAREALARDVAPRERTPEPAVVPEPVRAVATPAVVAEVPAPRVADPEPALPASTAGIADADAWHAMVANSGLRGPARLLAEHSVFIGFDGSVLRLALPAADEHLKSGALTTMVANALVPVLGAAPQIRFESAPTQGESLRERNERARDERQNAAESAFMSDPDVQRLISQHGAKLVPDSIRPFDEN